MAGVWPWPCALISKQFSEATGQSPSPTLPLCLPTAIEPQKEEADENCNSVNTRMRKTQVGLLFPELGHFSKYFIYYLMTKVRRGELGDYPNGETESQKKERTYSRSRIQVSWFPIHYNSLPSFAFSEKLLSPQI